MMTGKLQKASGIGARSACKVRRRRSLACAAGFDPRAFVAVVYVAALFGANVVWADEKVTYDDQIAPILHQRCGSCHNPTAKKADLDVTNYLKLMQGGASGTVIEAGDADSSYLVSLVTHSAEPYMPQNADKLPDAEIELLRRWIDGGALENSGSKGAAIKPSMIFAAQGATGARPEVIPMPPRMVLEPAFRMVRPTMARSLATSPWAPLVAVASQRQVLLYNTTTLELVGVFPFPEGQPNVVRFSRDGRLLLAGGGQPAASGKVVVWDITTGDRVFEVGNELDAVLAADISADQKRIALGGPQRRVKVYSTATGELQYEIAKHTDWVLSVEFSPDGVLLATADRNGGLCVWESDTGHEYLTLTGHTAAVNAVGWRGDSNVLASASEDATVRLWEMENGKQVKKWNAKAALLSMDFTRDSRIITGGRDQIVRLWDQGGKQIKETKAVGDIAVSVAFCDESMRAIAGSWAGIVQVYEVDSASVLGNLVNNPPPLDERLAAANEVLQQKTAASTPLIDALRKAKTELKTAQAAFTIAQQKAAEMQGEAEKLTTQGSKIGQTRAAADAERAKIAAAISQTDAARPLVAEALRQVSAALGKLPGDSKLAEVQRQLTEQQKAMETGVAGLQARLDELTSAVTTADVQIKETNARLESIGKESAAAAEQVKVLQSQTQALTKAQDASRKAAKPVESELKEAQQAMARWQGEISFRDRMAALQKEMAAALQQAADRQAEFEKASAQLSAAQSTVNSAKKQADEAAHVADAVNAKIQAIRSKK